jgi:hypothetical protein
MVFILPVVVGARAWINFHFKLFNPLVLLLPIAFIFHRLTSHDLV